METRLFVTWSLLVICRRGKVDGKKRDFLEQTMKRSHGNRRAQRKRRRRNFDRSLYREEEYQMIDGNMTHYPYAYCKRKRGWLTINMAKLHRCVDRKCRMLSFNNYKNS